LSEFHLLTADARVDAPASLSASHAPSAGSIAALRDGATTALVEWAADVVGLLALVWDFGAGGGADVEDIRLGSGADAKKFLLGCAVQWSDDAVTWNTSKVVYSAAWPGVRALTQSYGGASPYVRSSAYSIPRSAPKVVSVVLPLNLQQGSLLLLAVNVRSVITVPPAGWAEYSVSPATTALGQRSVIYAKTAAEADSGTTVTVTTADESTISAYMLEIACCNGTPVAEQTVVGKADGMPATPVSVLTSGGAGRLALLFAGTTHAFSDATATMTLTPASVTEWASRSVQAISGLRGAFFTRLLGVGGTTAGSITAAGSSTASAWTWNILLFVPGLGITQNRAMTTRAPSFAASPAVAVEGLPYGVMRMRDMSRGRKDFVYGGFGQGVGRVRGFTLDYVNPLNKPYRCRVRLMREVDGVIVREVWSSEDGSYDFQYVDELQSYTVLAYYLDHGKRAVVSDGLSVANGKVEVMA